MFLKWLFTSLAFLWIYHAVVRPLFMGFYYGKNEPESRKNNAHKPPPTPPRAPSARQRYQDDEGDYVDYEEVKK